MEINNLKFDDNGLIAVVTQSYYSGQVLMQAFATKEAIEETIKSGYATYFSRSRNKLWVKGDTSGNKQQIVEIKIDCDEDSLLYIVKEEGPSCHTNNYSCYYRSLYNSGDVKPAIFELLEKLYDKINERKLLKPEESYVARMFGKGSDKITQKVGEEAVETVIGLMNNNKDEIIYESSDLLFHLLMALADKGIKPAELLEELLKRYK